MILIAENLNSSIPQVRRALEEKDEKWLHDTAQRLAECPADYIDLNAGAFHEREAETLLYLVGLVTRVCRKPLVLDSPDPAVIRQAADHLSRAGWRTDPLMRRDPDMIFNSITLEKSRFDAMLETALTYKAGLVALLMDKALPGSVGERLEIAEKLYRDLTTAGMPAGRIFLDPCVRPVAADDQAGAEALLTIRSVRAAFPDAHVVAGISNISYGLPSRRHLNRAFLLQAMAMGLDSAIINPLDEELMMLQYAGQALAGCDEYCMNYLAKFRSQGDTSST